MTAFKDAIKADTREIKGYVEVLYDNPDTKTRATVEGPTLYNSGYQIIDGLRVTNDYATFEPNFFKTDGSFILPMTSITTTQPNSGYISQTFVGVLDPYIEMYFFPAPIGKTNRADGITLYFGEAHPTYLWVEIVYFVGEDMRYYGTYEHPTSDSYTLPLYFDSISRLYLATNAPYMSKPNRRFRVKEIDFGLTKVYSDDKLIDFKTTEEVDALGITVSKNEVNVTLSNYDGEFNILNPSETVKHLISGVPIYPHIGVKTLDSGTEYVGLGEYYLTGWQNNSDQTTMLTGQSLFNQLSTQYGTFRATPGVISFTSATYFNKLMEVYGITKFYTNITLPDIIDDQTMPLGTILEQLQSLAIYSNAIVYIDRTGRVCLTSLDPLLKDTIALKTMLSKPVIKVNNELKKLTFNITTLSGFNINPIEIHNNVYAINGTKQIIINFDKPCMVNSTDITGGGVIINSAFYGSKFAVLTLTASGDVTVNITGQTFETSIANRSFINNTIGEEIIIDNTLIKNESEMARINQYYLNNYYNYNFDVEFNGDPTLESGQLVSIETPFGYKTTRIKQVETTFNGGLNGVIKGDGN